MLVEITREQFLQQASMAGTACGSGIGWVKVNVKKLSHMRQLGGRGLYGGIDSVEQHVTIHAKCHTV